MAGPAFAVRKAQLDTCPIPGIREPHIDAHHAVPELGNRAFRQNEMRSRAAVRAEANLRVRIVLVAATISIGCALDRHVGRMEITPSGAGLAAQCAIAIVDIFRRLGERNADIAA